MFNIISGDYEMYEKAEKNVKKAANQIVENLNDIAKAKSKKGKDYLEGGKGIVDINLKSAKGSEVGDKLGKYIDKQVKDVKSASKKVKVDID
jgi:hypothetical protein